MAIVDANFGYGHAEVPVCFRWSGHAVTHAMEAYVSVLASEFSDGQALQALKLLKEYLPASYHEGSKNPVARERVHSAATIAQGIAFANAFTGVCTLNGAQTGFPVPYSAPVWQTPLLICNVIRYQCERQPDQTELHSASMTVRRARRRYAEIADHFGSERTGRPYCC